VFVDSVREDRRVIPLVVDLKRRLLNGLKGRLECY